MIAVCHLKEQLLRKLQMLERRWNRFIEIYIRAFLGINTLSLIIVEEGEWGSEKVIDRNPGWDGEVCQWQSIGKHRTKFSTAIFINYYISKTDQLLRKTPINVEVETDNPLIAKQGSCCQSWKLNTCLQFYGNLRFKY